MGTTTGAAGQRRPSPRDALAASLLVLVVFAGCSSTSFGDRSSGTIRDLPATTTTMDGPPASTATADPTPAAASVDQLQVRAGDDPDLHPYQRDAFGGDWTYDPATGCNTRERVLIEESLQPPAVDDRCRSTNGRWLSAYDGVVTTDPADLQIDHFIPLADAWRSGASTWSDARRESFANDLSDPHTLVAVTGSSNQSKSDSTPDEWLPPDRANWCAYATAWVAVKRTWDLTITASEKATLVQVLNGC